ncbi:CLUMA_CG015676, isoform A [Clunio marinus]|uniref:CLUMA_CG015676, isoform A n=1 Tax=Clunio marinus TaxID=568069 RepID=A0A1J1IP38_9DIPT|nr:CLUMA_CG015676, isoform A [Clunio marinus]
MLLQVTQTSLNPTPLAPHQLVFNFVKNQQNCYQSFSSIFDFDSKNKADSYHVVVGVIHKSLELVCLFSI